MHAARVWLGALVACSAATAYLGCGGTVGGVTSGSGGSAGSATASSGSKAASSVTSGAGTTVGTGSTGTTGTTGAGGKGSGGAGAKGGAGGAGPGTGGAGPGGTGGGAGAAGSPVDAGMGDAGDGGPPAGDIYAHSAGTLYKVNTLTQVITTVGPFVNCNNGDSMIDIALDKTGQMYGTTFGSVNKIEKTTAVCTLIATGSYPNSLSFVPAGTLDPVNEALVGYQGSTYVRIDTTTGVITTVGDLNSPGLASSGDIVSVINGGTYLTVNGVGCSDCIVSVDPKTGAMLKNLGNLNHSSVFGLAFWAGVAYGFDNAGEAFSIDLTTAVTTTIPFPSAPPGLSFYGAGSTTSAPTHG